MCKNFCVCVLTNDSFFLLSNFSVRSMSFKSKIYISLLRYHGLKSVKLNITEERSFAKVTESFLKIK